MSFWALSSPLIIRQRAEIQYQMILSSHLTLSFDNQCYVKTFTKRLLTNQTNQTQATESAHMTTTSSAPCLLPIS
eukprot:10950_6